MDVLRDGNISDTDYSKLCRDCIEMNDIRFRIKNKLNLISKSLLKEEKSYSINRLIIELDCNEDLFKLFLDPIKYFSFIYDEIIINSKNDIQFIKNNFYYDNTIKFNLNLNNVDFKKRFEFNNKLSSLEEIYNVMNINDDILNKF